MRITEQTWQSAPTRSLAARSAILLYGIVAYVLGVGALVYLMGFVGNLLVPKSLDSGTGASLPLALAIDVGLIALFGLQQSVMARSSFKAWWTRFVPAPMERSTYLVGTALVLGVLYAFWQPLGGAVWSVETQTIRTVIWSVYVGGWGFMFAASDMIDHYDLFGLRQTWTCFRGRDYVPPTFVTRGFYRFVRHPIQLGILTALWAAPDMSVTRLLFALGMTAYVIGALRLEERDLVHQFGDVYRMYRAKVGKLLPGVGRVDAAMTPE